MPKPRTLPVLLLVGFFLAEPSAQARPQKKFMPPPPARSPQGEMNLEASYRREAERPTLVTTDVGVIDQGMALPGINLGIALRIKGEAPLYLGGNLGIFSTSAGEMALIVPLLPEAFFLLDTASKWHPIMGLAAGPVFSTGHTLTPVRFGLFILPGINVMITNSLAGHFEARMGMIGSNYAFLPQVGITTWL